MVATGGAQWPPASQASSKTQSRVLPQVSPCVRRAATHLPVHAPGWSPRQIALSLHSGASANGEQAPPSSTCGVVPEHLPQVLMHRATTRRERDERTRARTAEAVAY